MIRDKLPFRLYPEECAWWSRQDYQTVLNVMETRHPKTVLEFGPGSSTLALIEGGAQLIHTCEDDMEWAALYVERLEKVYPPVNVAIYTYSDPLHIKGVDDCRYELGLIDGPRLTTNRPLVIRYALDRCEAVLVPTEDYERESDGFLRPVLRDIATEYGCNLDIWNTGPISGGFALLTRP